MPTKMLNSEDFDEVMSACLNLKRCPDCYRTPQIVLDCPIYGSASITMKCKCGRVKKTMVLKEPIEDGKRFGTPITPKSLSKTLFFAVNSWNDAIQKQTV